ncbi:MAG TPA: hypothetical protein VN642_19085 [Dongiaceae bacterium]|nr:hypothetical protein [Dongiaceae bacterium]
MAKLDTEISAFIARGMDFRDEGLFNHLMLSCFADQCASSAPYRDYCRKVGTTPETVTDWDEIPAIASFRHRERLDRLCPGQSVDELCRTSRTVDLRHTRGPFFPDKRLVELMRRVQLEAARRYLFPDIPRMKMLFFVPQPRMAPGMVMASGIERFRQEFGADGSRFLISFTGLDLKGFVRELRSAEQSGEPLAILGVTHGLDYFMDACLKAGVGFRLPAGSRIMDSGGFMGRYAATPPEQFFHNCETVFGISRNYCVNALWICESSTVYFDALLADIIAGRPGARRKVPPPWTRVLIVNPLTFRRVEPGKIGLIRLYDLSNRGMGAVVQTDKMGCEIGDGFEIIGKLDRNDPQGGLDLQPSHPGGKLVSRLMESAMRRKMAGIGKIAGLLSH